MVMDPAFIAVAFVFGLAARQVKLPPLVGYLLAGFALQQWGFRGGEILESVADSGVLLLLFCIGLKLRVSSLLRPEVWAGASLHMAITVAVLATFTLGVGIRVVGLLTLDYAYLPATVFGASHLLSATVDLSSIVRAPGAVMPE